MNYIHRLQKELAEAQEEIKRMRCVAAELNMHLCLPKFQGSDPETGERKDWIATQDVRAWTRRIIYGD